MDNKNSKTIFKTTADDCLTQLHQVDSDFALALALQEQERAMLSFAPSESSESESESDENSEDGDEILSDDETEVVNFLDSFEIQTEAELEFLGTDENSLDQEMEEDDIDPDELSYEELVDVGEIVGEESKGMKLEEISSCLRLFACPHAVELNMCVICQVDYKHGEMWVALPCDHPYHLDCITKWLQIKKICPICSSEVSTHKIARTV